MLNGIMLFLDREDELERLDRLAASREGGFAVVYGRRRLGKTRLLVEWVTRHGGLYAVADQSAPEVQRRYVAGAVAQRLPGFADVAYPDWTTLLARLAREAAQARWRGPIVLDELPYLVLASPELPSVLQRWLDHEAKEARLVVALAGSSQRMMQGLVLARDAPLYGRAREIFQVRPLAPRWLRRVFPRASLLEIVESFAAWGGVPRYWELAAEIKGPTRARIERLVLDRLGPLHDEPDRLLLEEVPSALEVRPVLDAIGAGAHRVSEVGARLGRPATSLSRPLDRLVGMGLARREVPFGDSERGTKRSLYRIADPFLRLWFRVVAPHRALLAVADEASRLRLLDRYWPHLAAAAWEELCRQCVPALSKARGGPWGPAQRWWASDAEWDIVAESLDGRRLLLGEAKWSARPLDAATLTQARRELAARPAPDLGSKYVRHEHVRALFVPAVRRAVPQGPRLGLDTALVVTADEVVAEGDVVA